MGTTEVAIRQSDAAVQRQEFGATELAVIPETAATAVAAREKAAVEARYIMAMNRPRSVERARQQILHACGKKYFAESAWFQIPNRGEGFTIRFAEEALRCFGNVYPETMIVFENQQIRMIRVNVTDLEANLSYSSEVIIEKTVERSNSTGRTVLGERTNSGGKKVFIVEATEDEITVKQNSALSKAIRTNGLRLIPSWITEEAKKTIFATMRGQVKADLAGERRKMIDAFAELGITVSHLEQYFGKPMDQTTPDEVISTRSIWTALKDGETNWDAVMEERQPSPEEKHGSKQAAQDVAEEKLRKIREETAQQRTEYGGGEQSPTVEQPEVATETPKGQSRGFNFAPGGKK